jgi:hypothetical protein
MRIQFGLLTAAVLTMARKLTAKLLRRLTGERCTCRRARTFTSASSTAEG